MTTIFVVALCSRAQARRVMSTVTGDTSPNHTSYSEYRNPTFCYIGTYDPLGSYNKEQYHHFEDRLLQALRCVKSRISGNFGDLGDIDPLNKCPF